MKPSPNVLYRELGDEVVLLDLESGKYFTLNQTGAEIWKLLDEGADNTSIARQLSVKFSVDESTAMADVEDLLRQLHVAGLILEPG